MRESTSSIRGRMSHITATTLRRFAVARGRDPIVWLIVCGCFLVTAITLGTMTMVGEFRERAIANSERELQNAVLLLTRHFDQQFEDTEIIAGDIMAQMKVAEMATPEDFRAKMSSPDAHRMLKSKVSVLSYVGDVMIFDADGQLISSSSDGPMPAANVSGRAYFKEFKSNPQAETVLTEPVRSVFTHEWTTVIAHRLSGADGIFLGVMARRIDPANYEKFFASVTLGPGSAISMFHGDGTMLARYPHVEEMIGKKFKSAPLMQRVLDKGGLQTMRVNSPVDHMDRLGAAAMLTRFPIVVVATNSIDSALGDWQAQTRFLVVAAALSASVIAFILFLIVRQINRQNADARRQLASEKQRLNTALNNMTQGLVLYDSSARIVTFNQRYIDMYHLSTDVVKPGLHYYDLIQHRKDTGSFDGDVRAFCDPIMRDVSQGKISSTIMETPDGKFLPDLQQAARDRRLGGDHRGHHRAPQARTGARPQPRLPARDHGSHPDPDHGEGRAGQPLRAGQFRGRGAIRPGGRGYRRQDAIRSCLQNTLAERIIADDALSLQSDGTVFIDDHRWQTRTLGTRIITSKRLAIRDKEGSPRYILNVVEDVTDRREADEKIAHLAHYDALTDLPNRVLFRERIERELKKAAEGHQFALFYIDIDEFKGINDSLGHHVGDELLEDGRKPHPRLPQGKRPDRPSRRRRIRRGADRRRLGRRGRRSGRAHPCRDPATLSMPRPSPVDRCLHRHRAGAAGRHRS